MNDSMKNIRRMLLALPVIIVVLVIVNVLYINHFNHSEHMTAGPDETSESYMVIGGRADSTSSWVKRDYDLYGEAVDLEARTIDGTLKNNAPYVLNNWGMVINIHGDCFINNGWCGTYEIHQNVAKDEKVQTLDLRNYNLDEIELEYLYDGDLLIPLHEGDYLVYYPSAKDNETVIPKHSELTVGLILYCADFPEYSELFDYQVNYHYYRTYTEGYLFVNIILLLGFWITFGIAYIMARISLKNAVIAMEQKKSGILSMSEIYSIIYLIDIKKDEIAPIIADRESEKLRPKNIGANAQLMNLCEFDSTDSFKEMMKEFFDLNTLPARMAKRNTIAFEYVSRTYGWCQLRFFAMDRIADTPLETVILTIQVINEEKAEIEAMLQRTEDVERENRAKSVFLESMSQELKTPINSMIELDEKIIESTTEPAVADYARTLKQSANSLLGIINGILDTADLETGRMQLVTADYSLGQLLREVDDIVNTRKEFENLNVKLNVTKSLPDGLLGDVVRIKQIIVTLLQYAAMHTQDGTAGLSVFGKSHDDMLHMLVSVKFNGSGAAPDEDNSDRYDFGLNLVKGILKLMGSELQFIRDDENEREFYFEIEQKITGTSEVGEL